MMHSVELFEDFIDTYIPSISPLPQAELQVLTPEQEFDEQHIAGINEESLAQLTDEERVINFDVSLLDEEILPSCAFNQYEHTNFTHRNEVPYI